MKEKIKPKKQRMISDVRFLEKEEIKQAAHTASDLRDKKTRRFNLVEVDFNSEDAYTKCILNEGVPIYLVKCSTDGFLYNPWSPFPERKARPGVPDWSYVEVNKEIYDLYQRFLQTRLDSYLRQAERMMI